MRINNIMSLFDFMEILFSVLNVGGLTRIVQLRLFHSTPMFTHKWLFKRERALCCPSFSLLPYDAMNEVENFVCVLAYFSIRDETNRACTEYGFR